MLDPLELEMKWGKEGVVRIQPSMLGLAQWVVLLGRMRTHWNVVQGDNRSKRKKGWMGGQCSFVQSSSHVQHYEKHCDRLATSLFLGGIMHSLESDWGMKDRENIRNYGGSWLCSQHGQLTRLDIRLGGKSMLVLYEKPELHKGMSRQSSLRESLPWCPLV